MIPNHWLERNSKLKVVFDGTIKQSVQFVSVQRRKLVVGAGALVTTFLAGCASDGDDDDDTGGEVVDDDESGDDEADDGDESVDDTNGDDEEEEQPDVDWGDTFETDTGLAITVSDPEVVESFEYEDFNGETEVAEPEDGGQFAFVHIHVENRADETRESPNRLSFEMVADGDLIEPLMATEYQGDSDELYGGLNDLPADTSEEGLQPFEIAEGLDVDDLSVYHNDQDLDEDADWEVEWGR